MIRTFALLLCLALATLASPALAFQNVGVGDLLPEVKLRTLSGEARAFPARAKANVFVFFRPRQEFSELGLERIVWVQERMKDREVSWTAIVSDHYPTGQVEALIEAVGFQGEVLVDEGDRLYGALGVSVHPSTGISGTDGVLTTDAPFRKVNYGSIVEAHLRHTLGEIDDAGLAALLDPPKAVDGGATARAKRNLRMGEMLFKMKKHEKVLEIARKSLELDPGLASAHGLIAAVHAAQGRCAEAQKPLARALELDPGEAHALAARAACPAP